jgi:hypothetical protein
VTLQALNRQLLDLGGMPVLWDTSLGTLVQDPSSVPPGSPQHTYGAGDVFRDAQNGDLYQLQQDGSLSLYQIATTAPTVVLPPSQQAPVSSAGSSWQSSPPAGGNPATGNTGAVTVSGDPTQWVNGAMKWLGQSSFITGLSNGVLLVGGGVAYAMLRQRRRGRA